MTRLNQFFREVAQTPAVRTAFKQAIEREVVKGLQHFADRFETARTAPAASSSADDGRYIISLYRELLGRAPDAAGFNAHLASLQHGTTRAQLEQVFLNSDEYRARQAAPVEPTPAPSAPVQLTGVEQLRALIAADLKTAGGREATEADYAYWLPKMQEPCDSGFVTSGQMTGVEYYHRRMLGWQAGGDDMAKFGPYAGSPDAHGPVPSAVDVVGPITGTTPAQAASSTEQLRRLIAADIRTAGGREATDADYAYWLPMLQSPCDSGFVTSGQMTGVEYYHRRMLGWQAGGDDMAKFGPYAGSPDARGPVPSAVDVVGPLL